MDIMRTKHQTGSVANTLDGSLKTFFAGQIGTFWLNCVLLVFGSLMFCLLAGCAYQNKRQPITLWPEWDQKLAIVQFDDYGSIWNADDAQRTLDFVSEQSRTNNTVVLMFVHGWHHNAREDDDNLQSFKTTLNDLKRTLDQPAYVQARKKLTRNPDVKIIGIYVGWRGRSLPCFLDYATIWGRKSAAEQVGTGDFREFCARLEKIYDERNGDTNSRLFMGFASVGHSLGAQVLFNAVDQRLEQSMIDLTPCFSGITNAPPTVATGLVQGLGDIVVLINPALEAAQFQRLSLLNTKLRYSSNQTPAVLVVSGEGDSARKLPFRVARFFTRPFRPGFRDDQKPLWMDALGNYEPQQTHFLTQTTNAPDLDANSYNSNAIQKLLAFDFTGKTSLGGGLLTPITRTNIPYISFIPVVVACTSTNLVIGHTGIFTEQFRQFLTDYVAFVEGKRAILNKPPPN